ncbi:MAG: N-6 DNA methylase [Burkholderiaceae bacterium]|jgi:hypothetical protein|nr:N-6 DNA methylase [Burkholderiaceae bacterium]
MAQRNTPQFAYRAIRIEGGLIPADELTRLTTLANPEATEQTDTQYRVPKGLKLRDEIGRYFRIALSLWNEFKALRARTDVQAHQVTVREFLVPMMRDVLGFTDIAACEPFEKAGHRYAVGHAAVGGRIPLVFAAHDQELDSPSERHGEFNPATGKVRRRSPYMLAQEALNASDATLWAAVTNGLTLRILRDNPSLTRPAYIEVDLEAIFSEESLADFTAFWLLTHATRFGAAQSPPADCPWERWRAAGQQAGVTVRGKLRYQVAEALRALGTGFLSHPANGALRSALQTAEGGYGRQAFFEELLRLVYRLIFLATVEDRRDRATGERLVFTPNAADDAKARYLAGYSMTWLRERAVRRSQHDRHADLWQALTITLGALARGEPALGLPALGGLFDTDQCPRLDAAQLENRHLLAAVFQLGWFRADGGLSRVNYRDMGPEELGSVYESLLELVPDLQGLASPVTARLAFVGDDETDASTKGNTRKLTGSYYTPDSLVQELIKGALEPVIEQALTAHPENPVEALLSITICDPACGSGHFLLSAARRLAEAVALHRAAAEREGGAPTPSDYRYALRDVVSRCIYGIDKNPMAIQLAKTALWLEAYSPDRPLNFIDHHLRVGDALLGVLDPKVLEEGIPEEAYTTLPADDKTITGALRRQNKADLSSWRRIAGGDLLSEGGLAARAVSVETLDDDTPEQLSVKREAWTRAQVEARRSTFARLADAYVSAYLAPKVPSTEDTVPLSGHLWALMSAQPVKAEVLAGARAICQESGALHWWLAFPQVAVRGGFDVMVGNPPWEQLQLSEEEFFAPRAPSIAALAGEKRKKAIAELKTSGSWLWTQFQAARRANEAANQFFRFGRRFPLTAFGKLNTYALFAETFLNALSESGRAGFVVPTGIATDDATKVYFSHVVRARRLSSLFSFYEVRRWFPGTDDRKGFCLLTLGSAQQAEFACNIDSWQEYARLEKRYRLTAEEFALLNPNTLTLPMFRSVRDAELTKKLYRSVPVLIADTPTLEEGPASLQDTNPWGIFFSQGLFNMTSDAGLFRDKEATSLQGPHLPLYEAKHISQFDHRWATYVPEPGVASDNWPTRDVSVSEKQSSEFLITPRHWVSESEVLARLAQVPSRVSRAWLALRGAVDGAQGGAAEALVEELCLALAQWVASELLQRATESTKEQAGLKSGRLLADVATAERQLGERFSRLSVRLAAEGVTSKKAIDAFPKWARQNSGTRLSNNELAALAVALRHTDYRTQLQILLDGWMDSRSPRWLIGWRDICISTGERTVVASVLPRVAVGHTMPLLFTQQPPCMNAALLANLLSLVLDYVARTKIGGTHLTYSYLKQFPILPPDRYSSADIDFIVPRVLELTYTSHDMKPWADDLRAHDLRPSAERGRPFPWSIERRAELRSELDAYYARLYGLTRDELRYVLDPKDVMGNDYPSETFRVLKDSELLDFGEYRTRRLVLNAWDRLTVQRSSERYGAMNV